MNGYQIVSESLKNNKPILLTGVSSAGKTTISHKIAKKLNLKDVIELDEIMRQLVFKQHPKLKSFYKKDLIEYFGDMKKAKKVMWENQLPAFQKTIKKYQNSNVLIEGMVIYFPRSYSIIDKINFQIYVIKPISSQQHLNKIISYAKRDNYSLSQEDKKRIIQNYKLEVVDLKKFIVRYKQRIIIIDN